MIKKLLLIVFAVFTCGLIRAQVQASPEQVRQVSVSANGVVNYESGGVEGFQVPQADPPPVAIKPVSEWDLQQCNETLIDLDQKLLVSAENGETEDVERYQQIKTAILERKAILTNQTQGQ